jgi:hypothetical protein
MTKTKSRRNISKSNVFNKITTASKKTIPVVASGLKKIGSEVKNITIKSKPGIEKGLGVIYKSLLTGVNYGVKGIQKGIHVIKSKSKTMRKSRSRSQSRRRRTHHK